MAAPNDYRRRHAEASGGGVTEGGAGTGSDWEVGRITPIIRPPGQQQLCRELWHRGRSPLRV